MTGRIGARSRIRPVPCERSLKARLHDAIFAYDCCMQLADAIPATCAIYLDGTIIECDFSNREIY